MNARSLPPKGRPWLVRITWPVTHHLITNLTVFLWWIFFRFFNRTTVIGKKNVPHRPNVLLLSNHQSMIDSFPIGLFAFFPHSIWRPSLLPWNPAAEENFFRNRFLAWLADNWKCIPIRKGRRDVGAIFTMAEALRTSPMILFPEGTRSRSGEIGRPRGGAGLLILETHPTVIPVCIDGMNRVLPIGKVLPRPFQRVFIYYGQPMDLSHYYSREKSKEVAQEIVEAVMERIREMQQEIRRRRAQERPLLFWKKPRSVTTGQSDKPA
ncbi:MAG: 1-acyl-sn-glycerol-3-phosphate acyltransferase [Calditrichaeota bacterium]|nr:MAG: 1-acyl-sn-glycerol-3-phosphate acyltransferase [Calditrichota bacterium]